MPVARFLPLAGLLLAATATTAARAQVDWEYTALADSSAELASFSVPGLNEAGQVAFVATFDDPDEGQAVYRYDGPGVLTVIATTDGGVTGFVGKPAINAAGLVAVAATRDNGSTSVLVGGSGGLVTVANTQTSGLTSLDANPFISDAGVVAVRGVRASDGARVILTGTGAAAPTVLLASTGTYDPVAVAGINGNGLVVFEATTGAGTMLGIYRTTDGVTVTPVAEVATGGVEDLEALDLGNNGTVTYRSRDGSSRDRLYTETAGTATPFADTVGAFDSFGPAAVAESSAIAFRGVLDLGLDAIFAGSTGLYERATAVGDPLDGFAITALDTGPQAVTSSAVFVFRASRANATSGIYIAVPVPIDNDGGGSSAVDPLVWLLLLAAAGLRRRC